MKNQAELKIILLVALAFLLYLFPTVIAYAAKIQSGVTVNAPSRNETAPTSPTAGTCGLQILSGVPINYGQLNVGQMSNEQKVTIKNVGTAYGRILVKGGSWISEFPGNPTMSGPGITHVGIITPNLPWSNKLELKSDGTDLGDISPLQTLPIYFQLKVPLSGFSGPLHQEVTIDFIC